MNYIQVTIGTTTAGVEPVGAVLLELGIPGFSIQDPADFESFLQGKQGHWDYIDEELMKLRQGETTLTAYLADNDQGAATLQLLRKELERLRGLDSQGEWGRLTCALAGVAEEDWAFGWKKYYMPTPVGRRLVICPSWEEYQPNADQVVVRLDPGMAFGTGTHDSTRLCLGMLEDAVRPGARVLDLGCGSGILAIASLLLGAEEALGVDIDQVAVKTAAENAALNGVGDRARFVCGSLAGEAEGTYDVLLMNIVADVIIPFLSEVAGLLKPGGVFIASGIIDTRADEVAAALAPAGLVLEERQASSGWVGLRAGVARQ